MKALAHTLVAAGMALATGTAAVAQSVSGDPVAGERLAREVCAVCHLVDRGEHGISLEGAPAFQDIAADSAMTSLALRVFFRSPHEEMPNLVLSDTETDDVIAYILSLK